MSYFPPTNFERPIKVRHKNFMDHKSGNVKAVAHGKTYKVIDVSDHGALSHVTRAPDEFDMEPVENKERKRHDHAILLMRRWIDTQFPDTQLRVVEA